AAGYAGRIGLKPNVIRSNGVTMCRRFAGAANDGPSGGKLGCVAGCGFPPRVVTPAGGFRKTDGPASLIGPRPSLSGKRADPLTTASTLTCCTSGFFRYFVFVHRYVSVWPFVNGK